MMPPLISPKLIIYHETIDKVLVSISQHPCLFLVSVLTTIITEKISSCIWLTNHTLDFPLLECLISQQYLKNIWTYLHNLTQYLYNLTNIKQYYLYLNIISVIFSISCILLAAFQQILQTSQQFWLSQQYLAIFSNILATSQPYLQISQCQLHSATILLIYKIHNISSIFTLSQHILAISQHIFVSSQQFSCKKTLDFFPLLLEKMSPRKLLKGQM